jgi:hypothetical protein
MSTCIEKRSSDLLKAHVKKKEKVKVQWMPYVLLNGAPLGDAKHGITFKQLQEEVCKAYKGSEEVLVFLFGCSDKDRNNLTDPTVYLCIL